MSAATAAKPDEASSPDGLVDESEYFKTSSNKAADLLYQQSKVGGGRMLSVADVARIQGVLQGFESMSTPEKHQQDAYNIRKRYVLGSTILGGTYRVQDVLQKKDGKVICPWEETEAFDALTLMHDNRKSTLHSPTPFYAYYSYSTLCIE